ncbi:hypothetical protein F511_33501 [Dorcoceras hygrometricum]|uniref:Uncharacterized protein n=1 Tax=Dorcoceras hygrometricum TaxID=472368 RepID=A0A2Z7AVZ8_9LAMI|nr:hypothetical protein F511_33501 [Dorcoceras hygrometricum]
MEDAGTVRMFQFWRNQGLEDFWGSGAVFEEGLIQFFANASVIAGTIVSTMANKKMLITMDVFVETFHLPMEGLLSKKKKNMQVEYRLLHDIVAKSLSVKADSFDVVTTEKFEMMVAIIAGLKVNWAHMLVKTLVSYLPLEFGLEFHLAKNYPGYAVHLSLLLEKLLKADLGDFVALHPLKVLNNKSVLTYMKKNQAAPQSGEGRKTSGDKVAVEPKKENFPMKKNIVAGSSAAPAKSRSETSSDDEKRPLVTLAAAKTGGADAKRKLILSPSNSESTMSLPPSEIKKKQRTKRPKLVKPIPTMEEKVVSKDLPIQVRPDSDQAAQQSTAYGSGQRGTQSLARSNPVEENCLLVIQSSWEAVSSSMSSFDEWARFRTEVRLNSIKSMTLIDSMAKIEDEFMSWAEIEKVPELLQRSWSTPSGSGISVARYYSPDDIPKITWDEARKVLRIGTTAAAQEAEEQQVLAIEQLAPESKATS